MNGGGPAWKYKEDSNVLVAGNKYFFPSLAVYKAELYGALSNLV